MIFFNKIKILNERIKGLEEANRVLIVEYQKIKNKSTPELVIEKLMERGIRWYDYQAPDKDIASRLQYFNEAQSALRNGTLINEINHLIADTIEYISKDTKTFEEVDRARRTIVGIELLKERLENIFDPRIKLQNN